MVSYTKQVWTDGSSGGTPLSAARLSHIEDGIGTATDTVNGLLARTRTGVYQFEHPNNNASLGAYAIHTRRFFRLTQTPIRWRVHYRNYNLLGDAGGGTMTGFTMYVGQAVLDANGEPTGAFTATPTQIITSTSVVGATEAVSPWQTYALTPYLTYGLSYSVNVASGQTLAIGGGMHFYTATPSDAAVAAPSGLTRVDNQGIGDMYIEFEFADNKAPVILVVSNSSAWGGNVGNVANLGEMNAWPQRWAMAAKGIAANISVGGSWAANYGATSTKWNAYSTLNTPLEVDAVVYMALCSSDIAGGDGGTSAVNTAKASLVAAVLKGRALYPNARHILSTNPPRGESSAGALENARLAVNLWLAQMPANATDCIALSSALTDWASPERLRPPFAANYNATNPAPSGYDNTHWSGGGHSVVSRLVPVHHGAKQ